MADKAFLAIDMGASSGRHVVGSLGGGRLRLEEVYRFPNGPVEVLGSLYWDLLAQWTHIRNGMHAAGARFGSAVVSLGIDTWGVDFGLLGRNDELLGNPYHYRDRRTDRMMELAFRTVPREEIFRQTGLQFMQLNTLYQLLAMKESRSPLLDLAERLLMMPDLFNWMLTGEKVNEFTDATTTQFYNPRERRWAVELLTQLGLPTGILGEIVPPGTVLGPLRENLVAESGLAGAKVVLPGSHDTASAVMAVPASGKESDWCYISLGTWALMGVEVPEPIINDRSLALNFTNEGGVGGTIRLLKNITGLWLVQECRRVWNQGGKSWDWNDLNALTERSPSLAAFVNPDAGDFLTPTDMPAAIRDFVARTGGRVPTSEGEVLRCALDSIAMKFRHVLGMCESLVGRRLETIHIVGGGTKNRILCQAAADACGRRVLAGPVEATAIGNIMMQAVAAGEVADIAQARDVIRESFFLEEYLPRDTAAWDDAYPRFLEVLERTAGA